MLVFAIFDGCGRLALEIFLSRTKEAIFAARSDFFFSGPFWERWAFVGDLLLLLLLFARETKQSFHQHIGKGKRAPLCLRVFD